MHYTGGCHCGTVTYQVEADIETILECNCSICHAAGWRLVFVDAGAFQLLSGDDAVQDYQFGNKHLHHPFCRECGIRSFSWGNDENGNKMYAVNTRCLEGFDASNITVNHYDGASL